MTTRFQRMTINQKIITTSLLGSIIAGLLIASYSFIGIEMAVIGVIVIGGTVAGLTIRERKSKINSKITGKQIPRRGWTDKQRKEIITRQGGICAMCGEYSGSFHFDHKDGNHYNNNINNAQALCPNCHDRKSRGLN